MPYIKVGQENSGSIELYYEDHGSGRPMVLIHGYPLSGRAWDKQVPVLMDDGHRVITYDRRGFGKSSQPTTGYDYDTFAADLHTLMETLDLRDVTLVGHSMGTGEVTRYLGRYGSERVAMGVLISPIPPFLLQTADNPEGLPGSLFDGFIRPPRDGRPGVDEGLPGQLLQRRQVPRQAGQRGGLPGELEHRRRGLGHRHGGLHPDLGDRLPRDLPKIDVPMLVIQGDDDRVLPYPKTGERLPGMIKDLQLVTIEGGPHAICWTHADQVNSALLKFMA